MQTSGDRLRFVNSPIEWTRHWQDIADLPNHNGPVWGYCPDLNESDNPDGPGSIQIVRYCHLEPCAPADEADWKLCHGSMRIRVAKWASIDYPEFPDVEMT